MKILLIASNQLEDPLPAFPLGVAYLAGNIDPKMHSVEVVDLMFEENPRDKVTSAIRSAKPDVIGISIRNVNAGRFNPLPQIAEIVPLCRDESDARIILGGTGFTMMPSEILTHFDADLGIQGEGVVAFNRLLERLESGKGWDDMPGLVWKDGGQIRMNDSSKDEDPNDFKAPARNLLDCQHYSEQASFSANILVQRGCPFESIWDDTSRQEGTTIRARTVRAVVDELETLKNDFGFRSATIISPKFNYPEDYARELCEEMISRDLGLLWMTDIHAYPSSPDLFKLMKRAGCVLVSMDVGACSEAVLKRMGVEFELDDIRKCCADLKSAELNFGFLLFFGGPGETKATVEESLSFIEETDPLLVAGEIGLRIYPNSPVAELANDEGVIAEDQDLYEPAFYVAKDVDGWIHNRLDEVKEHRGGFVF